MEQAKEQAKPIIDQMIIPRYNHLTPHGEKIIYQHEDKLVMAEFAFPKDDVKLPKAAYIDFVMVTIYEALKQIDAMKRLVPITRKEMEGWGVNLSMMDKAAKLGLIIQKPVKMTSTAGKFSKKPAPARACVYPTTLGRGYIRKIIDENYLKDDKHTLVGRVDEKGKHEFFTASNIGSQKGNADTQPPSGSESV